MDLVFGMRNFENTDSLSDDLPLPSPVKNSKPKITKYQIDTLASFELKILLLEDYIKKCQIEIDKHLFIEISNQSVHYKGEWQSIEMAKNKLWDLINSIKQKSFKLDSNLLNFLLENKDQIEHLLRVNRFKCILDKSTDDLVVEQLLIKSLNQQTIMECFNFLKLNYTIFELKLDQNSYRLVTNKKFSNFLKSYILEKKKSKF